MITKRTGNGQTECVRCKEKGKFALNWDSFLYTYNEKPYCKDCLFEMLEEKDKVIDEIFNYVCEDCPYSVAWKDDEEYKKVYKLCDCKNCQEDYKKCWLKYLENEAKAINK